MRHALAAVADEGWQVSKVRKYLTVSEESLARSLSLVSVGRRDGKEAERPSVSRAVSRRRRGASVNGLCFGVPRISSRLSHCQLARLKPRGASHTYNGNALQTIYFSTLVKLRDFQRWKLRHVSTGNHLADNKWLWLVHYCLCKLMHKHWGNDLNDKPNGLLLQRMIGPCLRLM